MHGVMQLQRESIVHAAQGRCGHGHDTGGVPGLGARWRWRFAFLSGHICARRGAVMMDSVTSGVECYKKRSNVGGEVIVRVVEDAADEVPAPTVVLFGWFGAKLKHVGKYAAKWEELGCSTVCCVAPTSVVFSFNHRHVPPFFLSVLQIVAADSRLTSGGVVLQFFSNGGAVCAPVLAQLLAGRLRESVPADAEPAVRAVSDALAAVVFDSAPCYMHEGMGGNAFAVGLGAAADSWLAFLLRAVFVLHSWLQRLLYGDVAIRYWTALRDADYKCPELYIYSDADALTDSARLQALVHERRARFKDKVHEMRVEAASHVRILLRYPDEYKAELEGVLEWGVNEWRRRKDLTDTPPQTLTNACL